VDAQGERRQEIVRTALLGACVFGLVFLIALGSSRSLASAGGGSVGFGFRPASGDSSVLIIAFGAVGLAALAYLVWVVFQGRRGESEEPEQVFEHPPIPWWSKLLLFLLALLPVAGIAAVVILSRHGAVAPRPIPIPPRAVPGPGSPSPTTPSAAPSGVDWWVYLVLGVGAVALVLFTVVVRMRRPAIPEREHARRDGEDLRRAIDESIAALEQEPDPRRAVIRAYVVMEHALARRGHGRRAFEAPLEYLARAQGALRLSPRAASSLTALFQRARFSEHAIGPELKREAIDALVAVRAELDEKQ
jgi:hypothetical protein